MLVIKKNLGYVQTWAILALAVARKSHKAHQGRGRWQVRVVQDKLSTTAITSREEKRISLAPAEP